MPYIIIWYSNNTQLILTDVVYHARIYLKSRHFLWWMLHQCLQKSFRKKHLQDIQKQDVFISYKSCFLCQIWTNLTFYTSFETYTCFYNASSIEILHYKMFLINKYRFSYRHCTTHNLPACGTNKSLWNDSQDVWKCKQKLTILKLCTITLNLLLQKNLFLHHKIQAKILIKAMVHNKGEHPNFTRHKKKN